MCTHPLDEAADRLDLILDRILHHVNQVLRLIAQLHKELPRAAEARRAGRGDGSTASCSWLCSRSAAD